MPGKPRCEIFDPEVQNTAHVWDGFVRDEFLAGRDDLRNRDHSHRVDWIFQTMMLLAKYFAIEVQAVALMENHMHHVLTNRPDIPKTWKPREVVYRWLVITRLKISGSSVVIEPSEQDIADQLKQGQRRIKKLRKRLANFSWYIGALKENISRRVNREDDLDGTLWKRRFDCRVAGENEGDESVQTMMEYVDLNPTRAGMVDRIEDSTRSSVGLRIQAVMAELTGNPYPPDDYRAALWLGKIQRLEDPKRPLDDPMYVSSATGRRASDRGVLPCRERDYFERLDQVARVKRPDKRGFTPPDLPPLMVRLGIVSPPSDTP
jgi:hypothetical protein